MLSGYTVPKERIAAFRDTSSDFTRYTALSRLHNIVNVSDLDQQPWQVPRYVRMTDVEQRRHAYWITHA